MRIFMHHHEIEIFPLLYNQKKRFLRNSALDHDVTGSENISIAQLLCYCLTMDIVVEMEIFHSFITLAFSRF